MSIISAISRPSNKVWLTVRGISNFSSARDAIARQEMFSLAVCACKPSPSTEICNPKTGEAAVAVLAPQMLFQSLMTVRAAMCVCVWSGQ